MDGSVSVSAQSTERTRDQVAQLLGKRTTSASTNSSLFEQLLSIPVAPQSPPPQSDTIVPETANDESSTTIQKSDDRADSTTDDAEDESESEISIPLIAVAVTTLDSKISEAADRTEPNLEPQSLVDVGETPSPQPSEVIAATTTEEDDAAPDSEALLPNREIELDNAVVQAPAAVQSNEPSQSKNQPLDNLPNGAKEERLEHAGRDAGERIEANSNPLPDSTYQPTTAIQPEPMSEQNAQVQAVAAEQSTATVLRAEEDSSRRSNRREKWFERDAKSDAVPNSAGNDGESALRVQAESEYSNNDVTVAIPQALAPTNEISFDAVATQGAQLTADTTLSWLPGGAQSANSPGNSTSSAVSKSDAASTNSITARFTAGQGSTTATTASASAKSQTKDPANRAELTQQERVRLIQRVSRSFNRITSEGGQINLRLHPQNLGSLNMQVRIEGRTLSAKLTTESSAARDAILQDLPALRQRLADQGYDVAKFQVEVAGNGSDTSFAQTDGQSQYSQSGQSDNRPGGYEIDYRRMATRSNHLADTANSLTNSNLNLQTSAGIDLHA